MGDDSQYNQNLATAEDSSCVPSNQKLAVSIASPTSKGGTKKDSHLSDNPEATPMLSLLLHTQANNRNDGPESVSNFSLTESELIKIEKSKHLNEKKSAINYQYKLLLTKSTSPQDAHNSSESGQNIGFYYTLEDPGSDAAIDVNYMNETLASHKRNWDSPTGSPWDTDIYRHLANRQIKAGPVPESPTAQDLQDSRSTTALLAISPALPLTPTTTFTLLPPNGLTVSSLSDLKDESHWYMVVDKMRVKENLTRRQLFQISAMMALGFVFVALIVVWVFSPILF